MMYNTWHAERRWWYDYALRTTFLMMVMSMHRRVRLLTNMLTSMLVHVRIRVRVVAKRHMSLWITPTIDTSWWERSVNRAILPIGN